MFFYIRFFFEFGIYLVALFLNLLYLVCIHVFCSTFLWTVSCKCNEYCKLIFRDIIFSFRESPFRFLTYFFFLSRALSCVLFDVHHATEYSWDAHRIRSVISCDVTGLRQYI